MCKSHKEFCMEMTKRDVVMMRLLKQAAAQGLAVAQHDQTREILLVAPTGEVHRLPNISLVRLWLRHYADCGRYGRRCCAQNRVPVFVYVPVLTPSSRRGFF